MDIEKYLDDLEIKNIQPGDTIILKLNEFTTVENAKQIFTIFKDLFPENSITWTHPDLLESIEVKKNV